LYSDERQLLAVLCHSEERSDEESVPVPTRGDSSLRSE
jgi:hypothetical protein